MNNETNNMENHLSIGELSNLTGIGVHTLRVWEKRYGSPLSQRLPSGHRRYPKDQVTRLKIIADAIQSGYRASKVATATMKELQGLLGLASFKEEDQNNSFSEQDQFERNKILMESWIKMIATFNDDDLLHGFHDQWGRHGPLNFILNFATPLLERIGKGWETGELTISHEHFFSECLVSFLSEKWRQLNIRKTGHLVLITTLPRETYTLGILMCAVVTCATNAKVIYMGSDSPLEEIIDMADKYKPEIITMSISHKFDFITSEKQLVNLRKKIDKKISLITGGNGSPKNISGVLNIPCFDKYYDFLLNFEQPAKSKKNKKQGNPA